MVNIIKDGDLFTVPADILINPVNRAGISGAGLAKEFKRRFPLFDKSWRKKVGTFPMKEGTLCITKNGEIVIVYFPTKHKPSDKNSSIELIESGLQVLKNCFEATSSKQGLVCNMPALGCGLGGLSFEYTIKPLILDMFQNEPYTINLFEPK